MTYLWKDNYMADTFMKESFSQCAMLTSPYKLTDNRLIRQNNSVRDYILALPLGMLCARCVMPFCTNS